MELFRARDGEDKRGLLSPSSLIFSDGFRPSRLKAFTKRLLDLTLSGFLLAALLPLFALVAAAIVLENANGGIFYRQKRVGRNGREFEILKFRSMVPDAEKNGVQWASENDDRITRVGGFIRKHRLDELPQLLNVLRGDMSLVGPRPERPEFVDSLKKTIPFYDKRHFAQPGITGWAQLNYPYGSSEKDALEKLQYDLYYVKHASVLFDLLILLQTAEVIFFRKGSR